MWERGNSMSAKAIVYTSNTGYTERYAKMLGEKTGLPVYALKEVGKKLEKGTPIIYLGWLMAGSVKGYNKAAKKYEVCAVCGVGLSDTGAMQEDVRKAHNLPGEMPVFTVQGGMDLDKLRGINKMMIQMLTKSMTSKKDRTEGEDRMVYLLQNGGDYVSEEHLTAVLEWYNK